MKMHFYKNVSIILIGLILNACGSKDSSTGAISATSSNMSGTKNHLELIGGSVTKEILINTNEKIKTEPAKSSLFLGSMRAVSDDNMGQPSASLETMYRKINKIKNDGVYAATQAPLIKPEYNVDLGVGTGIVVAGVFLSPVVVPAVAVGLTFGGSALKGYLEENRQNEIESTIATLTDRRDKDILLLALSEARAASDDLMANIHAGVSPEVVKELIAKYQERILENSELSPTDMEKFYKNGNDHFLLGLALSIKENQTNFSEDQTVIKKSLKQNSNLLKEVAKNSVELIEQQNKVLQLITQKFQPDERTLVLNALFGASGSRQLQEQMLKPDQLDFFKQRPELLKNYSTLLNSGKIEDIILIAQTQERAQKAYSYLQVSSQIANNLNLNPDIINAINKGATVASAITSISSFVLTSNPLDALNALSSLTGLFSKPKPDPRFTAIFENFKIIQSTLKNIQSQLILINNKLDNLEDGLNYVIAQNKHNSDLIIERSMIGQFKCSSITNHLSLLPKGDLNYLEIQTIFKDSQQGDSEKIDLCMRYMLDMFEDPFEQNKVLFSAAVNPDLESNESDLKKYFIAQNNLTFIYSKLFHYSAEALNGKLFEKDRLLSIGTVAGHVKQLLKSSFLFDIARVNRERKSWELVDIKDITKTTKANKKTEILLKNALSLVDVALVQQSVIDGNIENKEILERFISKGTVNCADERNLELSCLALSNPALLNNLVIKTFRKLIGHDFYQAWAQIARNNPDHLNEKLAGTPIKIVWVGSGASEIFSGSTLPSSARYADGAYVQVNNNSTLIPLPELSTLSEKGPLFLSGRVRILQNLKDLIVNELIERDLHNLLSREEFNVYNQAKRQEVLN